MGQVIQLRRDFSSRWVSVNPVLAEGEVGLDKDTNKVKIGDGIHAWNDLPYGMGGISTSGSFMSIGERGNYFYTSNNTFANVGHIHGTIAGTNISVTSASSGLSLSVNQGGGGGSIYAGDYVSLSTNNNSTTVSILGLQATSATTVITADAMNVQERSNYFYTSNNTFANSIHTHDYQSTGAYLTTAQSVGNYLTTAALSDHTHTYAGSNHTHSDLYVNTSVSSNFLTTAALSNHSHTQYLTTAAQSDHTHDYQSTGNYLTTAMQSGYTSVFQYTSQNSLSLHTSQSSLFQHTSATSIITAGAVNTSILTNLQYTSATSAITSAAFPSVSTTKFAGTGTTAYNATMTLNSNGLQLSVAAPGAAAENNWFNLSGNTSNASTASGSTIVLSAGDNITLAASNNSIIKIEAGGGGGVNRSFIEIMQGERLTRVFNATASQFSNRPIFIPFWLDGEGLAASTVRMLVSFVTNTRPPVMTYGAAIYTTNNTSQLGLLCSTTATMNYVSSQSASFSGIRALDITGMTTPIPDGRAILALFFSAAGTASMDFSFYGGDGVANFAGYLSGASGTAATNNTIQFLPWWGRYSANSGGFPSDVNNTQIYGGRSADLLDLYAIIKQI